MPWPPEDENMQPLSYDDPTNPRWLQRLTQAFSKPVERLGDVEHILLGQTAPSAAAPPASPQTGGQSAAGQYYLPGVGPTYLAPDFADRVGQFIGNAKKRGVDVQFASGYRPQAKQDALRSDPSATTPAKNSLHSAGRAFDIHMPRLANNQIDQAALGALVSDAAAAGLHWGGNFKAPDPGHFYYDPGQDRVQLIDGFTQGINGSRTQIPYR